MAGTAFRAPNIIERLFNGATPEGNGFQILNPGLSSERSRNFDLGMKYRRADAFMELVAFRNTVSSGIVQDFLSPGDIAALPTDVQAAIKDAVDRLKKVGKPAGMLTGNEEEAVRALDIYLKYNASDAAAYLLLGEPAEQGLVALD